MPSAISNEFNDCLVNLQANVVAAATPGSTYPKLKDLAPQHLVYSVGLMDYLDDRSLIQACVACLLATRCMCLVCQLSRFDQVQVADWAYDALLPGGKLVLGNFNRDASNRVASGEQYTSHDNA